MTTDFRFPRQFRGEFNDAAGDAEFIPSLQHCGLYVFGIEVVLFGLLVERFVLVVFELCGDVQHSVHRLCVLVFVEVQGVVCVCIQNVYSISMYVCIEDEVK